MKFISSGFTSNRNTHKLMSHVFGKTEVSCEQRHKRGMGKVVRQRQGKREKEREFACTCAIEATVWALIDDDFDDTHFLRVQLSSSATHCATRAFFFLTNGAR